MNANLKLIKTKKESIQILFLFSVAVFSIQSLLVNSRSPGLQLKSLCKLCQSLQL